MFTDAALRRATVGRMSEVAGTGVWGACIKQLGNAVPVDLAHLFAKAIHDRLTSVTHVAVLNDRLAPIVIQKTEAAAMSLPGR